MLRVASQESQHVLSSFWTRSASRLGVRCLAVGPVVNNKSDGKAMPERKKISDTARQTVIQGLQGRDVEFSTSRARGILAEAVKQSKMSAKERQDSVRQGIQDTAGRQYDQAGNVSLYSCMQSTVPHPYNSSGVTHLNMPGGGQQQQGKYLSSRLQSNLHPKKTSRGFSTSAVRLQAASGSVGQGLTVEEPCAQGIQGDDCVRYKLWKENCVRFQLADCDEQLQSFQSGRKTLAEIFEQQDQIIQRIVEQYQSEGLSSQRASTTPPADHDTSSQQTSESIGSLGRNSVTPPVLEESHPCPQGIQGQDCEQFKEWLHNCNRYQLSNCADQLRGIQEGRRTLAQIIQEQEELIASIARQYREQMNPGNKAERD